MHYPSKEEAKGVAQLLRGSLGSFANRIRLARSETRKIRSAKITRNKRTVIDKNKRLTVQPNGKGEVAF